MAPARVLVFGDSNAWGFWLPAFPGPPVVRLPFAQRWPGVAQGLLGGGIEVLEDTVPGRLAEGPRMLGALDPSAYDGRARLAEAMVRALPLQLVVIALGTNDLLAEPTPSAEAVRDRLLGLAGIATGLRFPVPLEGMPEPAKALILSPPGLSPDAPDRFDAPAAARERARLSGLLREACSAAGHGFADAAVAIPVPGPDGVHFGPDENAALGALAARAIADTLGLARP